MENNTEQDILPPPIQVIPLQNNTVNFLILGFIIGYVTASFYLLSFSLGVGLTTAFFRTDVYPDLTVYYNRVTQVVKKITGTKGIPAT